MMTLSEMEHDLDRMITMSQLPAPYTHPQEAEVLVTVHRWNYDAYFMPEVIGTNIETDLPHIIALMEDAITEKRGAQDDSA